LSHNTLVRDPVTNWTDGSAITQAELVKLDANLCAAINAVDGGCYAPTSAIIIGLAGLTLTGPLLVTRGGTLSSVHAASANFQCNDGDVPLLSATHTGRTRTVLTPCLRGRGAIRSLWRYRREDAGLQAYAPSFDLSDGAGSQVARAYVPIRAHDGATLASVTVSFRVGFPHDALPAAMPSVRVWRMDAGGTISLLTSAAAGADASGYVFAAKPTSPAAWYAAGGKQSLTVTCDQNNVVDVGSYDYVLELVEEQGLTGYPWELTVKASVRAATTANIALPPTGTIDGYVTAAGDRILVKDQTDPTQNGILLAGTGVRAADLAQAADFTQGMCVRVERGTVNGASTWQAASTITDWAPGDLPQGLTSWATATAYALNSFVQPTAAHATGFYYQATAIVGTGTSDAATEPVWPVVVGATVVDNPGGNQITWTCIGKTPQGLTFLARPDVAHPVEGTGFIPHGIIWHAAACTFTHITDTRPQ